MGKQSQQPPSYGPKMGSHVAPGGVDGFVGDSLTNLGLQAPASPDYYNAATQTAMSNRPDINTNFAQQQWSVDQSGNWHLNAGLSGPLSGVAAGLQNQAGALMGTPLDLNSLGSMPDPSKVRQQAIDAAYSQATSRLDPRFEKQGEALRTQLINQGLDPNSEAARNASTQFSQQKNDAYQGAMNSAIMHGTQAADSYFNQGMAARQQKLAEMLRQRGLPLQEMMGLMGLTQMPNVGPGADYLGAAGLQGQYNMNAFNTQNQNRADAVKGFGEAAQQVLPFLL